VADRVGLGWRPALAAGIFAHLDAIDLVEVMSDDYFDADNFGASSRDSKALRTLGSQVPIVLHGVSLGLASTARADVKRLDATARLVEIVRPDSWSEHLAFVRAGNTEIGHLAAPPRTRENIEGATANVELARRIVGCAPLLENIATLVEPPCSEMDEPEWVGAILAASNAPLLLDLHNLYANAINFGRDPAEMLLAMPLERVRSVHLAGGRTMRAPNGDTRWLDDHLHAVPDPVFSLLRLLAERIPQDIDVVLERDGAFPAMPELIAELEAARAALAVGRAYRARVSHSVSTRLAA
jgi:uncharacterized protein (UPF0276 family)